MLRLPLLLSSLRSHRSNMLAAKSQTRCPATACQTHCRTLYSASQLPNSSAAFVGASLRAIQVVFDEKMKGNFSHTALPLSKESNTFHAAATNSLSSVVPSPSHQLPTASTLLFLLPALLANSLPLRLPLRLLLLSSPLHLHLPLSFGLSSCQPAVFFVLVLWCLWHLSFIICSHPPW